MDEERDIQHAVSVPGIVVKITSWNNPFVWNCEIDCFINCFKGYALSILYCIHHLLTLFTVSLPCSIQKCCLMCHNTKSVPIRSNFFMASSNDFCCERMILWVSFVRFKYLIIGITNLSKIFFFESRALMFLLLWFFINNSFFIVAIVG